MRLKQFLAVSAVLFIAFRAMPCAEMGYPWESSAFFNAVAVQPTTEEAVQLAGESESCDFWYEYTAHRVSKAQIQRFFDTATVVNFQKRKTRSALYSYLLAHRDVAAISYLRLCLLYNNACRVYQDRLWNYENPKTVSFIPILREINMAKDKKFASRRLFLKMRCLFTLKRYPLCVKLWEGQASALPDSRLKDRIKGYLAGAYYHLSRFNDALDIYYALGDANSVNWCIDRMIGLGNIKALYEHNPRSLALQFLVQDFANYYATTVKGRKEFVPSEYTSSYDSTLSEVSKRVIAESADFVAFARKVVTEGKTDCPMLWQSAAGYIECLNGDYVGGYESLGNAGPLAGTDQMRLNLRTLRLWASLDLPVHEAGYGDYLTSELKFYYPCALKEAKDTTTSVDTYYQRVMNDVFAEKAVRYYNLCGQTNTALALSALASVISFNYPYNNGQDEYGGAFFDELDTIPTSQVVGFKKFLHEQPSDAMDKFLLAQLQACELYCYDDFYDELIGTKLMRDRRFDEALPYLKSVGTAYILSQAVNPYLTQRAINDAKPFRRSQCQEYYADSIKPVARNVKAEYCAMIIAKMKKFRALTGDDKAMAGYFLANDLFQASRAGDLWAISDYSWSSTLQSNAFSLMAIDVLRESIGATQSVDILAKCYFALAGIPVGDALAYSYEYDEDNPTVGKFVFKPSALQLDAYRFLAAHYPTDDPAINRCDVLRDYMKMK